MKPPVLFIVLMVCSFNLFSQFDIVTTSKAEYFKKPIDSKRLVLADALGTSSNQWDLTYNRLELQIDPAVREINGKVLFEFHSLESNLSSVVISLFQTLQIDQIKHGLQALEYQRSGDEVTIELSQTLQLNESYNFEVIYHGIPTSTGFGSFTQSYHGADNIPVIFTLSEPYGALEWWPCKQNLNDKIDSVDIVVVSPEKYQTASNGLLIENTIADGQRTCHWKHRHPIATYLVFFTTTVYESFSDSAKFDDGTTMEILNMVYPSSLEVAKSSTAATKSILEFYSSKLIIYPFKNEKYGHAQFSWGGGMEHQTMSSMGGFGFDLIAHEMAHQWFGDYITCGSWQDIWLNEGFATFLTGLSYEEFYHDNWWPYWRSDIVDYVTKMPGGSVWVADTTDIWRIFDSRLSYNKGAYVLHMLRGQLGDSLFFRGMERYLKDKRVVDGFATTELFREDMEQAADTSLSEYFNDWIFGEGFPIYSYSLSSDQNRVQFLLNQESSIEDGPFFEMKIPIRIWNSGVYNDVWLQNTQKQQIFDLGPVRDIDSIQFDPEFWLLCQHNGLNNLVDSVSDRFEFKMFPNPASDWLTILAPDSGLFDVRIFDLRQTTVLELTNNLQIAHLLVQQLNRGIYFVEVKSGTSKRFTKLIVR